MGIARSAARGLVPVGMRLAPHVGSGLVRELLVRAIDGVGPFRGAAAAAETHLAESGGDRAAAVSTLIDWRCCSATSWRRSPTCTGTT